MFGSILLVALQSGTDGLTFQEVVEDLPTDAASITVLAFFIVSIAIVLWTGTRPRGKGPKAA